MRQDTKQRLLEIGAETMHLKGYNHTGIQEILSVAGVPKGSFYNYFKSKEDFGLQVIDYFVDFYVQHSNQFFEDGSRPPLERVQLFLRSFMDFFRERDFAYGCPIGNFAQEMGDLSPPFRERLRTALDAMARQYEKVLQEAQRRGDLPETLDLNETAHFIVSSWQGALMRMKVVKSTKPLEIHMKFIFDHVLKADVISKDRTKKGVNMPSLKNKIAAKMKQSILYALATVTEEGKPWVRYVTPFPDDNLTVWMATFLNSRKVAQIRKNPEVHLTTGVTTMETAESWLQIQGRAEILTDMKTKKAVWNDHLKNIFSGPDDPNYCVCKITPYRIELHRMGTAPLEAWEA